MHGVYAILLPFDGEDPDEIFAAAADLIEEVADEDNWWKLIGLVEPDGTVVPAPDPSDRYRVLAQDYWSHDEWLDFVRELEFAETAFRLDVSTDDVRRMMADGGKEAVIEAFAKIIGDRTAASWRRQLAAGRVEILLDDEWPFPEMLTNWYRQRVYKSPDVPPEKAAIVLADIHT